MITEEDICDSYNGVHIKRYGGAKDVYNEEDKSMSCILLVYCSCCGKKWETERKYCFPSEGIFPYKDKGDR